MSEDISKINYQEVLEYLHDPIIIHCNHKIIYINQAAATFFKCSQEDVIGADPLDIFQESSKQAIKKRISSAYDRPAEVIEELVYRMDGIIVEVELYCHPLKIGETKAIQSVIKDITEKREVEKRNIETIREINALATTLVPLFKGVVVLPLVGSFDESRATYLINHVPIKVKESNVECIIIDFSGIYILDHLVADILFKLTNVMSMLGVKCIISGMRPDLAVIAIELDINIAGISSFSTVQEAICSLN